MPVADVARLPRFLGGPDFVPPPPLHIGTESTWPGVSLELPFGKISTLPAKLSSVGKSALHCVSCASSWSLTSLVKLVRSQEPLPVPKSAMHLPIIFLTVSASFFHFSRAASLGKHFGSSGSLYL